MLLVGLNGDMLFVALVGSTSLELVKESWPLQGAAQLTGARGDSSAGPSFNENDDGPVDAGPCCISANGRSE